MTDATVDYDWRGWLEARGLSWTEPIDVVLTIKKPRYIKRIVNIEPADGAINLVGVKGEAPLPTITDMTDHVTTMTVPPKPTTHDATTTQEATESMIAWFGVHWANGRPKGSTGGVRAAAEAVSKTDVNRGPTEGGGVGGGFAFWTRKGGSSTCPHITVKPFLLKHRGIHVCR